MSCDTLFEDCYELEESQHLTKRIKERTGLPKRAHKRFIKRFFQKGMNTLDVKKSNRSLYYYLMSISRSGYTLKILDVYILITSNNGIGVTILNIPKALQQIKQYQRRENICLTIKE